MELRIYPSDPDFEKVFLLATMIAAHKNPQIFFDLKDIPEAERLAEISVMEEMMEEMAH